MKSLITTSVFSIALLGSILAQDVSITNHNFDGFHSFPSSITISQDAAGDIWVLQTGGFDGNVISKYSEELWENVPFENCDHCVFHMEVNNDGVIYVSTGDGFFAWENDGWVKKTDDVTSREDFVFDSQNRLWFEHDGDPESLGILNTDGTIEMFAGIEDDISKLRISSNDVKWFVNMQEIVSVDDNTVSRYQHNPDRMQVGNNNRLFFTDFSGDLSVIEGGVVFDNPYPNADNGFAILALEINLDDDYMWLSNQGVEAGITLLNLDSGDAKFINNDSMYIDNPAPLTTEMFSASDGTLWAAAQFDGQVVEIKADLLSSIVDIPVNTNLFPNPVSNLLNVSFESTDKNLNRITIYDQLGNQVKSFLIQGDADAHALDLSELRSGTYYMQVGKSKALTKIVKI